MGQIHSQSWEQRLFDSYKGKERDKGMKKILSIAMALVLMLAMAGTAMAAQEGTLTGGSITMQAM